MGASMRVGVVGCGYWGAKHVRVLSELPEVSEVVVIDGRPEVRAAVGADHPTARLRTDLTSALDDVDAVVIATPPESHFELGAEAIGAGRHVLIEKPLTTSTAEALELVELADRAGVTLAVGHTFAHNDAVRELESLLAGGAVGPLHYLDAARLNLGLYRHDVNVLWDLAAHDIAITTLLLRQLPATVTAWGDRHTVGFTEDVASLRMEFLELGVVSTVRASWLHPEKVRRTVAVGARGMAVYDDTDVEARIRLLDRGRRPLMRHGSEAPLAVRYHDQGQVIPRLDFREPLQLQARDFLHCCRTGDRPVADGHAGLAVVAVLEAADLSLSEGGTSVPLHVPQVRLAASPAAA